MNSELFLITAYMVIWGGVFAYVFYAVRQQHLLAARVQVLEELIHEKELTDD